MTWRVHIKRLKQLDTLKNNLRSSISISIFWTFTFKSFWCSRISFKEFVTAMPYIMASLYFPQFCCIEHPSPFYNVSSGVNWKKYRPFLLFYKVTTLFSKTLWTIRSIQKITSVMFEWITAKLTSFYALFLQKEEKENLVEITRLYLFIYVSMVQFELTCFL